jgi:hypothetical protein
MFSLSRPLEIISVVDPEPLGIALILVGWIRIRIRNLDPDPKGKNSPSKTEKVQKFFMF